MNPQPTTTPHTQYTPSYDCDVCGTSIPESSGILARSEHFYCSPCAINVFHRSLAKKSEFPASCCSCSRHGLPPSLFADLLGPEFMDKYRIKLHKYYTPKPIRVYCANTQCAKYHHPRTFDDTDQRRTVVVCECGTTTCVGCKSQWEDAHVCIPLDPSRRPAWVPEYTTECLIKQCPKCREWIQLSAACNHITCASCSHGSCFVCLLEWTGQHQNAGCPLYNDPVQGYDDEGFERTQRGIHLYAGRDRDGYDRRGVNVFGNKRAESAEDVHGADNDRLEDLVAAFRLPPAVDEERDAIVGALERFTALLFRQAAFVDSLAFPNAWNRPYVVPAERVSFQATDFGLEALFAEECGGPSIKLPELAASVVCQCEFPVHQNRFELLVDTAEEEEYGVYSEDDSEEWRRNVSRKKALALGIALDKITT